MNILGTYGALFEAKTEEQWRQALLDLTQSFGFERMLFAVVPAGMALEQAFLRSTYTDHWRTAYDKQRMAHFDPTVAHCLTRTTPLLWSPRIFVTSAQKQMYEEARAFGLRSGLSLPMHGPRGSVGMFCLVTDRPLAKSLQQDMAHHLPRIALLRDIAFETSAPYVATHATDGLPVLTPRERECLKWTAVGKTSWEIAKIFKCSEATANFHLGNVRRKMGLSSRRAAAVKAVRQGNRTRQCRKPREEIVYRQAVMTRACAP